MSGAIVPLAVGGFLLVVAIRLLRAVARSRREQKPVLTAVPGEVIEVAGAVIGGERLQSPVQGLPAVYWHVRAVRIRRSHVSDRVKTFVDVDQSSSSPFWIRSDGAEVRVDPRGSALQSGHVTARRDQASIERSLSLDGVAHHLPASADGSRLVEEGVLVPGQPVWVRGRLHHDGGHPVLHGSDDVRLSVNTWASSHRRAAFIAIAVVTGGAAAVLLLTGIDRLA